MTHAHSHQTCDHKMKHCAHCDVAYCEKCGKEWGNKTYGTLQPNWPPYTPYVGDPPGGGMVLCVNAIAGEGGQRGTFAHNHG